MTCSRGSKSFQLLPTKRIFTWSKSDSIGPFPLFSLFVFLEIRGVNISHSVLLSERMIDDLQTLLRLDQMATTIQKGSLSRHPPRTPLSAGGDTSNLASCSRGTLKNKRALAPLRSSCSVEGLSSDIACPVSPPRSAVTLFRRPR